MSNDTPYQRLLVELGELINAAPANSKLPSEPKLAHQLGVSRSTLREAMRFYETQGVMSRKRGAGTFVIKNCSVFEAGLEVLESLESIAACMNLAVSMEGLAIEEILANEEIAKAMQIAIGNPLIKVRRIINAENRPIAILEDILLENVLSHHEMENGFTGSVLDLLIKRGTPHLEKSITEISAVPADPVTARLLNIQRGDPLLRFEASLISTDQEIIDYSCSMFIPGIFRFKIVRKIGTKNFIKLENGEKK